MPSSKHERTPTTQHSINSSNNHPSPQIILKLQSSSFRQTTNQNHKTPMPNNPFHIFMKSFSYIMPSTFRPAFDKSPKPPIHKQSHSYFYKIVFCLPKPYYHLTRTKCTKCTHAHLVFRALSHLELYPHGAYNNPRKPQKIHSNPIIAGTARTGLPQPPFWRRKETLWKQRLTSF